jgi:hypothetical protein
MKNGFVLSALAALVSASPMLEKRQGPFFFSPIAKPVKFVETDSSIKPGAKHVTVQYGPFSIPSGTVSNNLVIVKMLTESDCRQKCARNTNSRVQDGP